MRWPWPFSLLRRARRARPVAQRVGTWGEQMAARFLRSKGYQILGRNVRFGSRLELDLVARSPAPETLIFVEVKARRSELFGRPITAVNRAKQRMIGRAASRYLRKLTARPRRIRFDVVEVVGSPGDSEPVVRHIENAFTLGPGYRVPWSP